MAVTNCKHHKISIYITEPLQIHSPSLLAMSGQQLMTAACLGQRLVAAVDDVMELVRATVVQYEEESAQIRRENELLRSKLGEVVSLGIATEVVGKF